MSVLRAFFELEANRIVLNFAHGLIFFLLGFGVLLKSKRWSELTLAKSLPWLGLFGILNGIGDWGLVFLPIQTHVLNERVIDVLWMLDTALLALTYALLLYFGLHLLAETRPTLAWLPKFALVGYGVWLLWFVLSWLRLESGMRVDQAAILHFEIAYRYGFALTGSLISAWALSLQKEELERLRLEASIPPLRWVGASFLIHALAAGLIVPEAGFFPANIINDRMFFEVTAVPARLFTGVSGAIVAVSMLLSLEVFDVEFARRIDAARQLHTLMHERTRIARDLHDGIIQTLYGVGLALEGLSLSERTEPIREEIRGIMASLDRAIRDVRGYIMQLKTPTQELSLDEHLRVFLRQVQRETRVPIRVKTDSVEAGVLPPEAVLDILLITREGVSNASRHAKASEIRVALVKDELGLSLSISDDGIGFNPDAVAPSVAGEHQGLENMRLRAASIGGRLSIHSDEGLGTEILLRIPLYNNSPANESMNKSINKPNTKPTDDSANDSTN